MPEDLDSLRQKLEALLPERIAAAAESYRRFTADEPPADSKGFAAWHAAAKAALAHMEVLVKLARWAESGQAAEAPEDGLDRLLLDARAALAGLDGDDEEE